MSYRMDRRAYAETFGPTVGDRVRLADTDLFIEVEQDYTTYGDEVKFGGGKVIRDGMGQSPICNADGAVDLVITNALILDWWGIVKADIGIKDGRIFKIGKAGNPYIQDNVDIIIGPGTEALAGEGMILTAGGIDSHIHFICPQQIETAIASGITTMIGGGTGPATGTNATTCTPGPWNIHRMLQAFDIAFSGDFWSGFVIDVHAHEPETIYVVPIKSDAEHFPLDGKLRVYRSRSGGNEWEPLARGLPQSDCYVNVLRDAMAIDSLDPCGVYFGTTGGQVYASADAGDNWMPIVRDLPAVLSVEVQTLA